MRAKASLPEMLPEAGPGEVAVADGAICPQMVRCGKPGCECARGVRAEKERETADWLIGIARARLGTAIIVGGASIGFNQHT